MRSLLRRAPVTAALSVACVVLFALMLARGEREPHTLSFTTGTLVRFGALDPRRTWTGEPWRMLSAALVHLDPIHLLFNVWALWLLAPAVEGRLAPWRTALIVVGAQLGCASASLTFGDLTVRGGASGIAFGFIGAALLSAVRRRDGNIGRRELLAYALVGLGYSLLPQIDLLGHLGGLAGGAAMMAGVDPAPDRSRSRMVSLAFAALLLAIAVRFALVQPRRSNWNVAQAIARYERKDYAGAVPFLKKARALHNGDFADAYVDHDLGACLLQVGDRRGAIEALQRAVEEGSAEAALILGDNDDDLHRALFDYARALALEPQQREPRDAVIRAADALAEDGSLPAPADVAPLAHLPQLPALAPVARVIAAATSRTVNPGALAKELRILAPEALAADGGAP